MLLLIVLFLSCFVCCFVLFCFVFCSPLVVCLRVRVYDQVAASLERSTDEQGLLQLSIDSHTGDFRVSIQAVHDIDSLKVNATKELQQRSLSHSHSTTEAHPSFSYDVLHAKLLLLIFLIKSLCSLLRISRQLII